MIIMCGSHFIYVKVLYSTSCRIFLKTAIVFEQMITVTFINALLGVNWIESMIHFDLELVTQSTDGQGKHRDKGSLLILYEGKIQNCRFISV